MLDAIRRALGQARSATSSATGPRADQPEAPAAVPDDTAVAACALLLEIAHADGEFTADEQRHIESALGRHFNLGAEAVADLIAAADIERRDSVDHFHFTRQIAANVDLGQKTLLAEIMWGVILADGQVAGHEEYLVRKMANLLNLEPGYLSQARRAAGGGSRRYNRPQS